MQAKLQKQEFFFFFFSFSFWEARKKEKLCVLFYLPNSPSGNAAK